jgi:hypothetical protein
MSIKKEICISLCDKTGIMMVPWAEAGYTCYCVDLQHQTRKDKIKEYPGGGAYSLHLWRRQILDTAHSLQNNIRSLLPSLYEHGRIRRPGLFQPKRANTQKRYSTALRRPFAFQLMLSGSQLVWRSILCREPFRRHSYTFSLFRLYIPSLVLWRPIPEAYLSMDRQRVHDAQTGIYQQAGRCYAKDMGHVSRR